MNAEAAGAGLDDADAVQLLLPFDRRAAGGRALDAALDDVRARFGAGGLTRAVLLGGDDHLDVPLPPG
jgi:DNA polymerase-4